MTQLAMLYVAKPVIQAMMTPVKDTTRAHMLDLQIQRNQARIFQHQKLHLCIQKTQRPLELTIHLNYSFHLYLIMWASKRTRNVLRTNSTVANQLLWKTQGTVIEIHYMY